MSDKPTGDFKYYIALDEREIGIAKKAVKQYIENNKLCMYEKSISNDIIETLSDYADLDGFYPDEDY